MANKLDNVPAVVLYFLKDVSMAADVLNQTLVNKADPTFRTQFFKGAELKKVRSVQV